MFSSASNSLDMLDCLPDQFPYWEFSISNQMILALDHLFKMSSTRLTGYLQAQPLLKLT